MEKILLVTLEYPPTPGGIASYCFNLAANFPAGREVTVLTPPLPHSAEFDANHTALVRRLPLLSRWFWPRWLKLCWLLSAIVRREGIKHIFVHQALPVGYAAKFVAWRHKIPYTLFLHGTDVAHGRRPLKRRQFNWICRGAARIVVNSLFLENKLTSQVAGIRQTVVIYPAPGEAFFLPANPATLAPLRAKLGLDGKRVGLTVTRFADGKGLPHLLRALPKIFNSIPNIVWLFIGDGPKRQSMEALALKLNLGSVVRFLGTIPYDNLPAFYQLADIFCLLTHPDIEAEEGWGTVFVEAAAASLPVVAGRAGGVEEAVIHGATGFIVDAYRESEIVEAIREVLTNPSLSKTLGQTGRQRAEAMFRWRAQLKKIIALE